MRRLMSREVESWLVIGMLGVCWLFALGHQLGWLPAELPLQAVAAWSLGVPLVGLAGWLLTRRALHWWRARGRISSPSTPQDVSL